MRPGARRETTRSPACAAPQPGAQVVEPARLRGRPLHPGRPRQPRGLVGGEADRRIGGAIEPVSEHPGVLERHSRPLRQERQHRVAGVAEERQAPGDPRAERRVVEEPPEPAVLDRAHELGGGAVPACEGAAQAGRVVAQRPAFLGPGPALLDRDEVDEGAAAKRIAHEVPPGGHRDPRFRLEECGGDAIGRHQRAPGDVPGEPGRRRREVRGPERRAHAVRGDHHCEPAGVAFGRPHPQARAVGLDPEHRRAQRQPHVRRRGAGLEHGHEVDAVEMPVGPVLPRRGLPEPQPGDRPVPPEIDERDRLRQARPRRRGVVQPERREHGDPVRPDLDAGADLAEHGRLLEDPHPRAAPRQGDRDGEAADPRPDHRDLKSSEPHPLPLRLAASDTGSPRR